MDRASRTGCVLVLLVAALGVPGATAAEERCGGHRPTILAGGPGYDSTLEGTNGPDVIQGGDGDEKIHAGGGKDIVCGGGGDDAVDGGPGNDKLFGEAGNDHFQNSGGGASLGLVADHVIGGSGKRDVATYLESPVGVEVDLGKEMVVGGGESSRIVGIEVVHGSEFADKLVGNKGKDELAGWDGNDFIDGRAGNDTLEGMGGRDTVSYASASAGVRLTLSPGRAEVGTDGGEVDELVRFERAVGSDFDDKLEGELANDTNDELSGGKGDDKLYGFGGDDILEGGEGDDTIHPGLGDDYVDGGINDPVTSTGEHGDLATYANDEIDPNNDETQQQFEAYLAPDRFGNPPGSDGVGKDVFASIESVRGVPGKTNIIEGDDGPNVIIGGGFTDALIGRGGNDLMFGLGRSDSLDGDAGDDFLDGGQPEGEDDTDRTRGGEGTDTCIGAQPDWMQDCENVQQRL